MVVSWFREMYRVVGRRLVMKAYIVAVFTWFGYDWFLLGLIKVVMIGRVREARVVIIMEVCMVITFIWSCTNIFWFLKPMDSCYPLKVEKAIVLSMGAWVSNPCEFSR